MKTTTRVLTCICCSIIAATLACSKEDSPEPAPESNQTATKPEPLSAAPAADSNDTPPAAAPSGKIDVALRDMLISGSVTFKTANCIKCHGDDGTGTERAPDLTDDEWLHTDGSLEGIRGVIVAGISKEQIKDPNRRFGMRPIGQFIQDEKVIDALAAYVHSLSQGD